MTLPDRNKVPMLIWVFAGQQRSSDDISLGGTRPKCKFQLSVSVVFGGGEAGERMGRLAGGAALPRQLIDSVLHMSLAAHCSLLPPASWLLQPPVMNHRGQCYIVALLFFGVLLLFLFHLLCSLCIRCLFVCCGCRNKCTGILGGIVKFHFRMAASKLYFVPKYSGLYRIYHLLCLYRI